MSDQQSGTDHTQPLGAVPGAAEGAPEPAKKSKRTAVIAGSTAGAVVVLGLGAYAAVNVLGGGGGAEAALPANTMAVVSMDIDPTAQQKIEAIKTLRKFPQLRENMEVNEDSDLRKEFFDSALEDCDDATWAADVEPWIGSNVALGVVPDGDKPMPVVAVAVTDTSAAEEASNKLGECMGDDTGFAMNGDFLLMSDSDANAKKIAEAAQAEPLTEDEQFQTWSAKAGDRGIVNLYVAKSGADFLLDNPEFLSELSQAGAGLGAPGLSPTPATPSDLPTGLPSDFPTSLPSDLPTGLPSDFPTSLPSDLPTLSTPDASDLSGTSGMSAPRVGAEPSEQITEALKSFEGAAGAVRFADGGAEISFVGGGVTAETAGEPLGDMVTGMPDNTALLIAMSLPTDAVDQFADSFDASLSALGTSFDSMLQDQLGLERSDLETIFGGGGIALAAAGDAPSSMNDISGPDDVPAALVIRGDSDKINEVTDKVESKLGLSGTNTLQRQDVDGGVALSLNSDAAKLFDGKGDLGGAEAFSEVVPEADKAAAVVFVDFNSDWKEAIVNALEDEGADTSVAENLEPLGALGISSWVDGSESHVTIKLTTD